MNIKLHYIVTICALFFLGVMLKNPNHNKPVHDEDRSCKMIKGRMDCVNKYSDYKIYKNSEVKYKLN